MTAFQWTSRFVWTLKAVCHCSRSTLWGSFVVNHHPASTSYMPTLGLKCDISQSLRIHKSWVECWSKTFFSLSPLEDQSRNNVRKWNQAIYTKSKQLVCMTDVTQTSSINFFMTTEEMKWERIINKLVLSIPFIKTSFDSFFKIFEVLFLSNLISMLQNALICCFMLHYAVICYIML